ncbi:MAG TPA: Gfo/Idh/MocA family oxidoreductase, partial [Acidimicrobiales bacterium]|nr:Gfo/Idh/MocA family oxidoreductase [Acidimicrobiales bacterium]
MRIAVVGVGATGARAARQLASTDTVESVLVADADPAQRRKVAELLGERAEASDEAVPEADVVLVASPAGTQADLATRALRQGSSVVTTSDAVGDVRGLLDLDAEAVERHAAIVVGAGFAPGLSCLLARHAVSALEEADELHIAKVGTGGPACAEQHHRALGSEGLDWREGGWQTRSGGSGRELCWFPEPVGGRDCYRAAVPDPLLLVDAFPQLTRVTARLAANRRDRLTARLPMLRRPHPEGGPGAIRVEVRGARAGSRDVIVYGAMDRPAVAAGAVAAVSARAVGDGTIARRGAFGLAA